MKLRPLLLKLAVVSSAAALVGCAHRPPDLYLWETFPRQQYETLLREGASASDQIRTLEAHAERARASGAILPPGFRAHLGMLHINLGNVDQARQLWLSEKAAFPESGPYMDQLLGRLNGPAATQKPANSGNPA